jgi:uncharacterized Zn finger protein (UPF0148 family)
MTMNSATGTACPHCGSPNPAGSTFCGSCGKALPTAASSGGPRIVAGAQFASTAAGQKLQSDELHKQAKRAAGALLAVAIIQTAFGALVVGVLEASGSPAAAKVVPTLAVTVFGVAAIFWGLYFWARRSPFPAAIVGLVVYVSLWLLDLIAYASAASKSGGKTPLGAGPFNGIIVRIIIIVVLLNAIKAGARHRQLLRQQAGGQ